MSTLITIVHITTCVLIVVLVLLQSGKGAEASASLTGGSQTILGTSGGTNIFQKLTAIFAAIFFATSLTLTVMGNRGQRSVFERTGDMPVAPAAPDAKAPAAPDAKAPKAPEAAVPAAPAAEAPKKSQ